MADLATDLNIRLQPKQSLLDDLWDDPYFTRIGFGGARGGAKSGGGRRIMLRRRLKYDRTTGLILRRTFPELEKSHILKLFEEYPQLRQFYNEQKKVLSFPNGSTLFFGSAPYEKDMADFYSAEFADIMPDEAQEFSQGEIERLSGSLRCTSNSYITPKMVLTFMPGVSESGVPPKGLPYLKRVFKDHVLRGEETRRNWAFVQAFSWDNIEWARNELTRDGVGSGSHRPGSDKCECQECVFYSWPEAARREYFITRTEYGATLSAMTDIHLRNAWLDGSWDVYKGQFFPNFNYEAHTIEDAEIKIQPWHKRWLSGDWGFDHPACIHWHAMDEHGQVVTYRELWGREIGETELGKQIGALSGGEKLSGFYFSWDAFGKLNKTTKKSITQMIGDALPKGIPRPNPADATPGSRISGWRLMHHLLDGNLWKIARSCHKLIECIPTLVRDLETNSEDVLKVDYSENYIGDDAADSARYGLQGMLSAPRKPLEVIKTEEQTTLQGQLARLLRAQVGSN